MDLPETMTAIAIARPGGPEVLQPVTLPVPRPGRDEVLIRVAAAGVNRPDVAQRRGLYPPPEGAPATPGLEVAGTVVALGPPDDLTLHLEEPMPAPAIGDAVCALVPGGGYAEYCVAPLGQVLPVPGDLDMVEAAALPETAFTVWDNLFTRGGLKSGETLLIHGGSSGIGTMAIQLAHAHEVRVFATAGSAAKCAACVELGAERAMNFSDEAWERIVQEVCGGVDVILDMVGLPYFQRNLDALALEGRLVQIAFLAGARGEVDLEPLMRKRLTVAGSTMRPRNVAQKTAVAKAVLAGAWPLIARRRVEAVIHATFPLAQAADAHALMESSAHIGKIVLET